MRLVALQRKVSTHPSEAMVLPVFGSVGLMNPWPDAQVTPARVEVGGQVVSRWHLRREEES